MALVIPLCGFRSLPCGFVECAVVATTMPMPIASAAIHPRDPSTYREPVVVASNSSTAGMRFDA